MAPHWGLIVIAVCLSHIPTLLVAVQPGGLACEGCHGVVTELHEKLSKPTKASVEERAAKLVDKICKLENLVKYVYSPPKMVKACNELIKQHRDSIVDSLIDHFDANAAVTANELEADICFTISKSCEGIKASPDAKVSDTVVADQMLDGKSGQNIVLQHEDGKIVTKVQDDTPSTDDDTAKKSKDKKAKPKSDDGGAKKKPQKDEL
ncbi:hypothetical protein BV898_01640 [Hypsibius exemplaris]|uniref:Saposin B-type domain-containing protein n=1 Tax=Hypsibius exemplaris TaxID=2072580 RepID=A0A1W0XAY5_HYPEX|nr:hypothetical protein BV898_01640 [Hypsibius exemplaris]